MTGLGVVQYLLADPDHDAQPESDDRRWTMYTDAFIVDTPHTVWARAVPVWQAASEVTKFVLEKAFQPQATVTASENDAPVRLRVFDAASNFDSSKVFFAWESLATPGEEHTTRCVDNEVEINTTFGDDDERPFPRHRELHLLIREDGKLDQRMLLDFQIQQVPEPDIVTQGAAITFNCVDNTTMFFMWEKRKMTPKTLTDASLMQPCLDKVLYCAVYQRLPPWGHT